MGLRAAARALICLGVCSLSTLPKHRRGRAKRAKRPARRGAQGEDGPKKRRVNNRFSKLTNTHLLGTAIGDVLAEAQKLGGDGMSATGGSKRDTGDK